MRSCARPENRNLCVALAGTLHAREYDGLLHDKAGPSRVRPLGSNITERVVALTQTEPPAAATHWTSVVMAKVVDISAIFVRRISRAHGLQPQRAKQSKLFTDRNLLTSCMISAHAVVLSVDVKIQMHALDHKADPNAFTWTANPDKIIEAVRRGYQVLGSSH